MRRLPDGAAATFEITEKLRIAVFRMGDRVAAIDDRCPHAGASLSKGAFDGTVVKCPLHGFRVDVWKSLGTGGKPVKCYPVHIEGGEVRITFPD